ncbi:MAG: sensor histidine kinase, partial [Roseovarius sp.]
DFVANVSHELRTPLTALMGFIETLQGPARHDQVAIDRFLGIMQSEAARMERLVRDLLSLSRVESEERVRPRDEVNLGQVIGSVLHALRPLARDRACDISFEAPEGMVVRGNDDQLQQVFTNLVENAIKYGGKDNRITITLERTPRDATLRAPAIVARVRDQGPGIDPLHIPRLTERFYRVDTHRSREMGGTGLGLAIVKHIVNRHRGRLRISSTPGEGSEFSVILPQWDRQEP